MTSIQPSGAGVTLCKQRLGIVLAATTAAYLWTLQFGFVYDDLGQIVSNPLIQNWRSLPMYFRGNVWMQQSQVGNYYRPFFLTWFMGNHTLFGMHSAFWHLTTIAVHLAATALVYWLALRLTRDQNASVIAALIFGVHPVHVESVAWISGVTDPLMTLFMIPSFLAFMNYRDKRGAKWLWMSLGLFACALLTKETAIILPGLLVAYVLLCPDAVWKTKVKNAVATVIPYALVGVVYLAVRAWALKGFAHTAVDIPAYISFYTLPSVLWFYLKQLLLPFRLSAFYDTPYVTHISWKFFLAPLLGVVASLFVVAYAWWKSRSPLVPLAAAWLLLPLVPVLNVAILPMGDFIHDRYLYVPSIGFAMLVGLALSKLDIALLGKRTGLYAAGAVAAAMMVITVAQSLPWTDDIPLYQRGMQVAPINDLPRNKLAATYVARGMYEQGIRLYAFVLANDPDYWYANYRMGYAQYMTGHYGNAQHFLAKSVAVQAEPDALYYLGLASAKLKQYDAAEGALREALKRAPKVPGYAFALGMTMKEEGKLQPALEMFRAELSTNPNDPGTEAQITEVTAKLNAVK